MNNDDCAEVGAHNCDEALEKLYEYLDSELDEATTEGIRSHLDDCGHCYGGFDFELRLKVVVRERLSEEVPPQFIARLRTALDQESTRI
jgi:mycothiol system anti-sigma-R factor